MSIAKRRNYTPLIWFLSITINLLIAFAYFLPDIKVLKQYDLRIFPLLNAIFNSITFIALLFGLYFIKRRNIIWHKRSVFTALYSTALFLVSYLVYHFGTEPTRYGGVGLIRYVYFFILITHITLAAIIVPIALVTIGYGLNMNVIQHRKIAKWTMPIWLYVSFTGVIVYLMISPYYN
jgi:putative membrane protein